MKLHLCILVCCYMSAMQTGQIAHSTPCKGFIPFSFTHWSLLFCANVYPMRAAGRPQRLPGSQEANMG
jgi:hypothetical protein